MTATERLLKYVRINTQSNENSDETPSDKNVFKLAEILADELRELGVSNVNIDYSSGCLYALIPPTPGYENRKKVGFIAHMDTSPDYSGENVNPQVHENYDGNDIKLGNSGKILKVSDFPHLSKLKGRTLITTDGNSLLGADDKAGISAIMTMAEYIINEKIPHGQISIAFTPDEEVGRGTDNFDIVKFNAEYAYTVDGDDEGEIVYENFNAASAVVKVNGFNVHPGSAKNTMINAALVLMELNSMLPAADIPSKTDNYEGFYHLTSMSGDVESAQASYIIRDHSKELFNARKYLITHAVDVLNEKYGKNTVNIQIKDSYYNMCDIIKEYPDVVEIAKDAIKNIGIDPISTPIRGGTDGARLTFMGLPCPNLGTGGHAFHGPYEHITSEGLDLAAKIVIEIVRRWAD